MSSDGKRHIISSYRKQVTHEHVVPVAFLATSLLDCKTLEIEQIKDILLKNTIRCLVTSEEGQMLADQGLNKTMPGNWALGDNPFERYINEHLKIEGIILNPQHIHA